MKVLKVGKLATKIITCPQCESELEYTQEDITKQEYCYEGGKCGRHKGYKELITCPVCQKVIEVGKHETGYTSSEALKYMYHAIAETERIKEKLFDDAKKLGYKLEKI